MFLNLYKQIINFPKLIILLFLILVSASIYQSKNFKLDASADTLLIENDPDLLYLRELNKKYKSEEFFIITYTPKTNSNEQSIKSLEKLVKEINNFKWVSKTISVINAPLLQSSNEPLMDRIKNLKYIVDNNIDNEKALKELINSPVYRNLIISSDGKTFGVIVYLKDNKPYLNLLEKKSDLLKNKNIDQSKLKQINNELETLQKQQSDNISFYNKSIKNLIKQHNQFAEIRLSGIPMIADDMITFIKKDIIVFGIGVFIFIIFTLWLIFKNIKWVIFPLLICFVSISIMVGFLSTVGWKVTVISSNFIALMLILTMSMNIHYLVRYMQIGTEEYSAEDNGRIFETSKTIFYPILYAVLTTICAFLSLIFSEIKPVIDFGWMMTIGLIISFITTFVLLPSLIKFFNPPIPTLIKEEDSKIAKLFLVMTKKNILIYFSTVVLIIASVVGISKLKVENSFVNYFDKSTEIYKGMKNIDEKLGGTTPLEIILKFKKSNKTQKSSDDFLGEEKKNTDNFLGETNNSEDEKSKYWFTRNKIDKIIEIHKYLEKQPEIGKVLSFFIYFKYC